MSESVFDPVANSKLDELTKKVDRLEEMLGRLAKGLDISLEPEQYSTGLPRGAKSAPRDLAF